MNAKFFGNSLFGGEFFVKDFPLSDENPDSNILKLSFQGIGNNLVITGRTSDGRTLTIFGVADTTSVTFDVTNENGTYTEENNNLTWEWEDNLLKISVSTYGFIKAVIYNPDGKEIVAKENSVSVLRKTEPEKAYYNCHTDITIPYDELSLIEIVRKDNTTEKIIVDGRFVLPGTEELNEAFMEN
jgi:hypothetical protein